MTPEQFCYWLQGYFELADAELGKDHVLTEGQMEVVREHLRKVFNRGITHIQFDKPYKSGDLLTDSHPWEVQFKHYGS